MGIEDWSKWMTAAQKGDQAAYTKLLNEIYPAVKNFLIMKLGPLGFEEDICQECLMAIHKARASYDSDREFRPWMYAVVRNKLIDSLRKRQRVQKHEIADSENLETKLADPAYTDNKDDHAELVQEALDDLPEEMQRAVRLTKIEGLSTKEAAEKENTTEAAIRTRISRAYKLMRKKLEKEIGW